MRGAYAGPGLHEIDPVCRALAGKTHAPFQGEGCWVTPGFFGILMHPSDNAFPHVVGWYIRGPAVSEAPHPAQHGLGGLWVLATAYAEPDGDRTLHWERIQARVGDVMPLPLKVHHLLRPQSSHDSDLFGAPASPVMEVLPQRIVFYLIPAHPNAEPQAA